MKKIAIVTGASRGIGRAVAKRLAQDGFAVVVNYLSNASEAEEVVAEIKVIGGEAIAVKADVANQTDVERLFNDQYKIRERRRCGSQLGDHATFAHRQE